MAENNEKNIRAAADKIRKDVRRRQEQGQSREEAIQAVASEIKQGANKEELQRVKEGLQRGVQLTNTEEDEKDVTETVNQADGEDSTEGNNQQENNEKNINQTGNQSDDGQNNQQDTTDTQKGTTNQDTTRKTGDDKKDNQQNVGTEKDTDKKQDTTETEDGQKFGISDKDIQRFKEENPEQFKTAKEEFGNVSDAINNIRQAKDTIENNPEILKDRDVFEKSFNYENLDQGQKNQLDALWQNNLGSSEEKIFNELSQGREIINQDVKDSDAYANAKQRIETLDGFESIGADGMLQKFKNDPSEIEGTQALRDLKNNNPDLYEKYQNLKNQHLVNANVSTNEDNIFNQDGDSLVLKGLNSLIQGIQNDENSESMSELYNQKISENEKIQNARSRVNDINTRVKEINRQINNVRQDVRKQFGEGVPKSLITAEVQKRTKKLQRKKNELNIELQGEQSTLNTLVSDAKNELKYKIKDIEQQRQQRQEKLNILRFGQQIMSSRKDRQFKKNLAELDYKRKQELANQEFARTLYKKQLNQQQAIQLKKLENKYEPKEYFQVEAVNDKGNKEIQFIPKDNVQGGPVDTFDTGINATGDENITDYKKEMEVNGEPGIYNFKTDEFQPINSSQHTYDANALDTYISSTYPDSPINGNMVAKAAKEHGVDAKAVAAVIANDSSFGTAGAAVENKNPGNVKAGGETDSRGHTKFDTWEQGVNAVAKNLSKRVKEYKNLKSTSEDDNPSITELMTGKTTQGDKFFGPYMTKESGPQDVRNLYSKISDVTSRNLKGKNESEKALDLNEGLISSEDYKKYKNAVQKNEIIDKLIEQATDSDTGVQDFALVTSVMKTLDPGSVVQEGEFQQFMKSQGIGEEVTNMLQTLKGGGKVSGDMFTEETRQEMASIVAGIASTRRQQFVETVKSYRDLASRNGVDPDLVYEISDLRELSFQDKDELKSYIKQQKRRNESSSSTSSETLNNADIWDSDTWKSATDALLF